MAGRGDRSGRGGGGRPAGGRGRPSYEERVASDIQHARLRLARLKERHAKRQELLGARRRRLAADIGSGNPSCGSAGCMRLACTARLPRARLSGCLHT